jgi:hypothetical protein
MNMIGFKVVLQRLPRLSYSELFIASASSHESLQMAA